MSSWCFVPVTELKTKLPFLLSVLSCSAERGGRCHVTWTQGTWTSFSSRRRWAGSMWHGASALRDDRRAFYCCTVTTPASAGHSSNRCSRQTTSRPGVLFYSLAVLDPSVGHTMDVLSPFMSVLCHSDCLFHGESCPRLDVTIRYDTIRDAILTCARKPT